MEVEETGTTFQENAMLKATEYYSHSNIPTLADDSGLIVNTPVGPLRLEAASQGLDGEMRFNLGVGWKF